MGGDARFCVERVTEFTNNYSLKSMILLCVDLVKEGVEKIHQLDVFRAKNCELIQGWVFSEAVSVPELETILETGLAAEFIG